MKKVIIYIKNFCITEKYVLNISHYYIYREYIRSQCMQRKCLIKTIQNKIAFTSTQKKNLAKIMVP